MFAVIETGGKQYVVETGKALSVEKLPVAVGGKAVFDKVLLIAHDDGSVTIGQPYIEGAAVEAVVQVQGRAKKKIVFRYHSKTRYRKKKGHRQHFTKVAVVEIGSRN